MRHCALETTSLCEGGLSGEHYISRALLDVIAPDGKISIEGLPWAREAKSVGPNALTATILCRRHNSLLSPLDTEAAKFATFLRDAQLDLASGEQVVVDEAYIRESILMPAARVTAGFQPVMPAFQGLVSEEGLLQLIEYVKSLTQNTNHAQ